MGESVFYGHGGGGLQQQMHSKGVVGTRRREGGSPPLPSWKLYKNPFYDGLAAAVVAAASAAAAVAMAAEHHDDAENEEDEGDQSVQKHGFQAAPPAGMVRRTSSTSFTSPTRRAPSALATKAAHHLDNTENAKGKANWAVHQGFKAQSSMAVASRSSTASVRRGPSGMTAGGTSVAFDKDATHRSTAMQGAYEKEALVRSLDGCTPKDSMAMESKASVGIPEVLCEEDSMSLEGRAANEVEASVLTMAPSYPIFLPAKCEGTPSPCSPRSHLQPRPPASTSDSPCSSKPIKASKVSTRSPQLIKSPQRTSSISPPLKTITLMRPKAGCESARLRGSALKSASSSQCSPLGRDAVEQHVPPIDGEIITSPRDYLQALNRSRGLEEKRMEGSPIISALSEELKRALTRVQELEHSQISARKEVDGLLKRFADERALLRTREQEKIQAAVFSIEEDLDKERKVRRKLELENRKLSRNLAEASKAVVKAEKELDKERKARQLMEDVCDELAKEIGEDKAEFEELKREHAKAREEMDEERRTIQMTEAWREERVQMKLSEAKFELEERCVALDKLKMELEMFLNSRQRQGAEGFYESQGENLRAAAEKLTTETSWSMLVLENSSSHAPYSQDDALSSDDIHSLRLSRDNIRSHSEWGLYSDERARDRAKWVIDSSAYARDGSGQIIVSDNNAGDESMLKMNAYPDLHSSSWIHKQSVPRWGRNEESMAGLVPGPNGRTNFDDSDSGENVNSDGENEAESNGAGSTWGDVREDEYHNLDERRWSVDGEDDDIRALRRDVIASGSPSEDERGSLASFSPESSRKMYKQGMKRLGAAGLNQDHRGHGARRDYCDAGAALMSVAREPALFLGAKHNAEEENELSSAAGSSPVDRLNANSPDFMVQKGNWLVEPVHRGASQGRRALVESSAPQGRKDLVEWAKPFRGNSHQTKLLLDEGMNGLHLQSRRSKGPRLKR